MLEAFPARSTSFDDRVVYLMRTPTTTFSSLSSAPYVNLTTFRKNSAAVPTPVWFALYEPSGTIYVETGATSGKVKRIRHTPRITLAQCTARGKVIGEVLEGEARLVTETEEIFVAKGALHHKYGFKRQAFYFVMNLFQIARKSQNEQHAYIAIDLESK